MRKLDIQVGTKFGYLTVVKELESNSHNRRFRFKCSCGNVVDMLYNDIKHRRIRSCRKCRSNSYTFLDGVAYGKDSKQREFSLDERDFPLIAGKIVYVNTTNYGEVIVWLSGKKTVLHDLLCLGYDKKMLSVDHIDNDLTNNNRSNLRLIDKDSSFAKRKKSIQYHFGLLGVMSHIHKKSMWELVIRNSHILYEGEYTNKTDALYAERLWLYFNYDVKDTSIFLGIPRYAKIDFVKRTGSKKRKEAHQIKSSLLQK